MNSGAIRFAGLLMLGAGAFALWGSSSSLWSESPGTSSPTLSSQSASVSRAHGETLSARHVEVDGSDARPSFTSAQEAIIEDWERRHGYDPEAIATYRHYERPELKAMARNGDVNAMHALAMSYAERVGKATQAQSRESYWWRQAAVHGSTMALRQLAGDAAIRALGAADDTDSLKETLVLYKAAMMRGDRRAEADWHMLKGQRGFELSHDERRAIESRARAYLKDLERERQALGLGPFDNTVPEPVERSQQIFVDVHKDIDWQAVKREAQREVEREMARERAEAPR